MRRRTIKQNSGDVLMKDNERPDWLPDTLFPYQSRFLDIDGSRIHYVDEGSGPVLLLLHGNPTWSFVYRDIIQGLKKHFRCIALDYPGFGLSRAAPDYTFLPADHARVVERFVLAMDLNDMTMMVQDWGGPIGLWVAGRHPERVRGLIIGNTFAWPVNGDPHFEHFSTLMGGPVGGFLIRHFNAFVNLLIPAGVRRKKLPGEVMTAYRKPFPDKASRLPTRIFPREITRSHSFLTEVEAGLANLTERPVLILWPDRDIAFRAQERARFEVLFPRHQTIELRGAGHYIQEDAPAEIVDAVQAWESGCA